MKKLLKLGLIFAGATALTMTTASAKCGGGQEAPKAMKCQAGKCGSALKTKEMKCQAGKCGGAEKKEMKEKMKKKAMGKGKCGQGKCGSN